MCCRYEIEQQVLKREISIAGFPKLWNSKIQEKLGCFCKDDVAKTIGNHLILLNVPTNSWYCRYEIEQQVLKGEISIDDIPKLWNSKMQEYLGCTPKNDAEGCLQDVHWSAGIMGYFPTYSLGAMYACQIYQVHICFLFVIKLLLACR